MQVTSTTVEGRARLRAENARYRRRCGLAAGIGAWVWEAMPARSDRLKSTCCRGRRPFFVRDSMHGDGAGAFRSARWKVGRQQVHDTDASEPE